jgi:hypothetical protein
LGAKYNPRRVTDTKFQDPKCFNPDFSDSRDLFIHGIIDGDGGTCSSMPVLYVAVGRRLGYPLKLVETRGHLFFRWDDSGGQVFGFAERFNIEGAGGGIASYADDHYRNWPEPWTAADKAGGYYLKSLTPLQELTSFLSVRGKCLFDNRRLQEAVQANRLACRLAPDDPRYKFRLQEFRTRQLAAIENLFPPPNERIRKRPPPHGDRCPCPLCTQAREPSLPILAGHAVDCQCFECKRGRVGPATLGHQISCTCRQCELARRDKAPRPAGHSQGCPCSLCKRQPSNRTW